LVKIKFAVPNKNSTEDQWNEVYNKLGRPESAEKYELNIKSEVVPIEPAAIKQFAENAHKLGLNTKQAQGVLEFYKNNMEGLAKQEKIRLKLLKLKLNKSLDKSGVEILKLTLKELVH
jgi:hypothetical protein